MTNHDIDEEVRFWETMIEWWESKNGEKAPSRMYEALDFANSRSAYEKLDKLQPGSSVSH